jgi:hypothetical protein
LYSFDKKGSRLKSQMFYRVGLGIRKRVQGYRDYYIAIARFRQLTQPSASSQTDYFKTVKFPISTTKVPTSPNLTRHKVKKQFGIVLTHVSK